jgi:hypothetical protein
VKAGKVGEERSWGVRDVIDVEACLSFQTQLVCLLTPWQYILQIILKPPSNMSQHLPSVRHEETIQVATDVYGSQERELLTMGGRPTPALGLVMLPGFALGRLVSTDCGTP